MSIPTAVAETSQADPSVRQPGEGLGEFVQRKSKAYLALTKPRVIELLLVTTLPTMIFAQHGWPDVMVMVATMVGGALAAASAGAFNCYIDRDVDKIMKRTKNRPLVTGEITPGKALAFSWVLGVISVAILWLGANALAGLLGIAAILLYVVFYTLILKRHTTQNIVWGGVAGCMPVFIAWAAVTGTIEWPAVALFLVIFLWTPSHYWPLSMKYADDYEAADLPMLGAVATGRTVATQVVLYAWATVACSLLLIPMGAAGWVYTVVALVVGGMFIAETHRLYAEAQTDHNAKSLNRKAMRVFHFSNLYLTFLFIAVAIDPFVGQPVLG
ncbi:heme o synthase [Galactobacter caseinivorans]|uniref:Protoheme IX farnesyltransferase n=1 Tax=Galactobacter caseinivorans TaxID=2676123 RepID=A0A496PKL5_9MICC|nr:heme o synthase [Galactobacter caseinivorans]RKW71069.1 protoheme IX farnesyltransferase [Galactobacter caseinivorans]